MSCSRLLLKSPIEVRTIAWVLAFVSSMFLTLRAVGGIYSVIKSKAPVTTAEYGERYTLIGPLNHQSVSLF